MTERGKAGECFFEGNSFFCLTSNGRWRGGAAKPGRCGKIKLARSA